MRDLRRFSPDMNILIFWTLLFLKECIFLTFHEISQNSSLSQTTMLTRFVSKIWVEPRSPFLNISHHDPKTIWKTPNIVSWSACWLDLNFQMTPTSTATTTHRQLFHLARPLSHSAQGWKIPFRNPSLRRCTHRRRSGSSFCIRWKHQTERKWPGRYCRS